MLIEVNQMLGDQNFLIKAADSRAHKEAVADIIAKTNRLLYQFTAQGTLSLELDMAGAGQDIRSVIQAQNAQEFENLINVIPRVHARYNDTSTKPSRPCHPGTRIDLLQIIRAWIYGGRGVTPYFWLCGEVGVGKTTVAHSVAQENEALHQLGASFFFSRYDEKRRTPNLLFISIAYQLARFDPRILKALAEVLKPDPDIVNRSPMEQFKRLVLQPLTKSGLQPSQKVVIVIDGLDECLDPALILDVFTQGIDDAGVVLRVLISSRPYALIISKFKDPRLYQITSETQFRDINPEVLSADVTAYLTWELGALASGFQLLSPWPPQAQLDELIRRAAGLFIIASSYAKYIDNPEVGNPVDQLRRILSKQRRVGSSPLAELDTLYDLVLDDLKAKLPSDIVMAQDILTVVIHGQGDIGVQLLADLLSVDSADVRLVLRHLAAVIPLPNDDSAKIIPFHASFGEYIQDSTRCTILEFACEKQVACGQMVTRCVDIIASAVDEGIIGVEYGLAEGEPWTPELLFYVAKNFPYYASESSSAQVETAIENATGIKMWDVFNIISGIGSLEDCLTLNNAVPGGLMDLPTTKLHWSAFEPSGNGLRPFVRRWVIDHYISKVNQIAETAMMARETIEVETSLPMQRLEALKFDYRNEEVVLGIMRDVRCWAKYTRRNLMSFKHVGLDERKDLSDYVDIKPYPPVVTVSVASPAWISRDAWLLKHMRNSVDLDVVSRVRLVLGIADSLQYLHGLSPPQPHNAIDSDRIMISGEGQPILCPPRWELGAKYDCKGTLDVQIPYGDWQLSPWSRWNPTFTRIREDEWQRSLSMRLQVDVWDFGSIVYQVFSGEAPHTTCVRRGLSKDRYEAAVSLLLHNVQAPDNVKELLKSCWTIEAQSRPPMSEVFNRLKAIVEAMET